MGVKTSACRPTGASGEDFEKCGCQLLVRINDLPPGVNRREISRTVGENREWERRRGQK